MVELGLGQFQLYGVEVEILNGTGSGVASLGLYIVAVYIAYLRCITARAYQKVMSAPYIRGFGLVFSFS